MTSDCYAILGVTPEAEDVVIGAAYRALIRHYHPDTNPDPGAQARAREITAAYAVLRDPEKRAEYDAGRGVEMWPDEAEPARPPPLRAAGIASALLAVGLVAAVWTSIPAKRPTPAPAPPAARTEQAPAPAPVQLAPEEHRLAALAGPPAPPPEPATVEADLAPVPTVIEAPPPARPKPAVQSIRPRLASAPPPATRPKLARDRPRPASPPQTERVLALEQISTGFFSQSMTHADAARKALLEAARDRSAAERKACRSDSCVADAYVRQIRSTSAIMEGKAGPQN